MIEDVKSETRSRMQKSIDALIGSFARIRTGRAHPGILDGLSVEYYGVATPLSQVASVTVEDARTLAVSPWEKQLVPLIEKAIMKSNLGLNPSTSGNLIRLPMPALTEETRKTYIKQARQEAESTRVSLRNIRRDSIGLLKELEKDKEISGDEERRAQDGIQKITDEFVAAIDKRLEAKETDLMEI